MYPIGTKCELLTMVYLSRCCTVLLGNILNQGILQHHGVTILFEQPSRRANGCIRLENDACKLACLCALKPTDAITFPVTVVF